MTSVYRGGYPVSILSHEGEGLHKTHELTYDDDTNTLGKNILVFGKILKVYLHIPFHVLHIPEM